MNILQALRALQINPANTNIPGLRTVIFMYMQHEDKVSAHRQLTVPKYQAANRRLSRHIPVVFHIEFNEVIKQYSAGYTEQTGEETHDRPHSAIR